MGKTKDIINRFVEKQYNTAEKACTEIINLEAILNLPKGTEHFLSDIHGEDEAFLHMIKSSSGVIRKGIDIEFRDIMSPPQKERLAITVYYPEEMIKKAKESNKDINVWYEQTLFYLIKICRHVSRKYTRSKVRKALPEDFCYIIEELLHETEHGGNKKEYYESIIQSIINIGQADQFITAICYVIQQLAIDRLHIVGDIFDRGPGPHLILDALMKYHSVDIQWGNHDIVWMGAAMGNPACIATVIRICARYGHLDILEEGYGINLRKLAMFASKQYATDACRNFKVRTTEDMTKNEKDYIQKIHKAISIIQLKIEGQIIKRNPQYQMENRLLLGNMNLEKGTIAIEGVEYTLNDTYFPTVDLANPYELTSEEQAVIDGLCKSFLYNFKLGTHLKFLIQKGSMYLVHNNNLILHGCIPMNANGSWMPVTALGGTLFGKEAMDVFDQAVRKTYINRMHEENNTDIMWYLWKGNQSPLFGKDVMRTFERYFVKEKKAHQEKRNAYYSYREDVKKCQEILAHFGITAPFSHIVNGHVPVKVKEGEIPAKAGGKLIVIDGGLNPAYQTVTGIAGYTLIYDSYSLEIVQHQRFKSKQKIIENEKDIISYRSVCDQHDERFRVGDTDTGKILQAEIEILKQVLKS